jgi:hypothetical protein
MQQDIASLAKPPLYMMIITVPVHLGCFGKLLKIYVLQSRIAIAGARLTPPTVVTSVLIMTIWKMNILTMVDARVD